MAVTNYFTVVGEIIGESTNGVQLDYLTDALGSVTATVDQTGTVQNTYRYKPNGALLAKTGTAPDPKFTWVGSKGYRIAQDTFSDEYVRLRHYSTAVGKWITADPVGFLDDLNRYQYSYENPTFFADPSGLTPCCCCNAVDVTVVPTRYFLTNPKAPGKVAFGTLFSISLKMNYIGPPPADLGQVHDCKLQYFDKSTIQANGFNNPAPPNMWKDDYIDNEYASIFLPWTFHVPNCPGPLTVQLKDYAIIVANQKPDGPSFPDRILCLKIKLTSGADCTAKPASWVGYQLLSWDNWTVVAKEGDIPYCKKGEPS